MSGDQPTHRLIAGVALQSGDPPRRHRSAVDRPSLGQPSHDQPAVHLGWICVMIAAAG